MTYSFQDWQDGKAPKKGWDCADAIDDGWSKDQLDAFMRATARPWSPPQQKPASEGAERVSPAPAPQQPAGASASVREARTTEQAKPESATVTQLHTRKTLKADDSWKFELITNDEGKLKPGVTKNWALFLEKPSRHGRRVRLRRLQAPRHAPAPPALGRQGHDLGAAHAPGSRL
ncbi:hypothetical protein RFN29_15330 [Mesorhizobium sp. VK22B]|uniref:Uncharacterized protein n=1 Tax=Mesorhizobium captivum TaxID=3072319 RepID=A0ABU4Z3N3_9HYPH|nr:hypothetical protein [Mesorhizobium sp. VK22B]MDX8492950.1 hypothetical protein [Mesorhizobium sp. VK22B]